MNATSKVIYEQIKAGVGISTVLSWGVSRITGTTYNGMDALALRVNGFYHKGWVITCYNEGTDTYEVYLLDKQNKVKHVETDVYCDEVGQLIDSLVECPTYITDDEYSKLVDNAQYSI